MIPPGLKIDTRTQKIVRLYPPIRWQDRPTLKIMVYVIEVRGDGETRGEAFEAVMDDLVDLSLLEELAFAASQ